MEEIDRLIHEFRAAKTAFVEALWPNFIQYSQELVDRKEAEYQNASVNLADAVSKAYASMLIGKHDEVSKRASN